MHARACCARGPHHSLVGRAGGFRFSFFQGISKCLFNLVLSLSLENYSKYCRCPKIVKQNLLGSQKCYLSVGAVSLQLSVIMIDSLIHLGKLSTI